MAGQVNTTNLDLSSFAGLAAEPGLPVGFTHIRTRDSAQGQSSGELAYQLGLQLQFAVGWPVVENPVTEQKIGRRRSLRDHTRILGLSHARISALRLAYTHLVRKYMTGQSRDYDECKLSHGGNGMSVKISSNANKGRKGYGAFCFLSLGVNSIEK